MKYRFTGETMVLPYSGGKVLHRIEAVSEFYIHWGHRNVYPGELGGWIEKEENLSQEDDGSWVCDEACVYDNAVVKGNANVCMHAKVSGNAIISDDATIRDYARIKENAKVYGHASVGDYAEVMGNAEIYGGASVHGFDFMTIKDEAKIYGNARIGRAYCTKIDGKAQIHGDVFIDGISIRVGGYANVSGFTSIGSGSVIQGNAVVVGSDKSRVEFTGRVTIVGDAEIHSHDDFVVIGPFGHGYMEANYITIFRGKDRELYVAESYDNKRGSIDLPLPACRLEEVPKYKRWFLKTVPEDDFKAAIALARVKFGI